MTLFSFDFRARSSIKTNLWIQLTSLEMLRKNCITIIEISSHHDQSYELAFDELTKSERTCYCSHKKVIARERDNLILDCNPLKLRDANKKARLNC